jgi:hypothetical protein
VGLGFRRRRRGAVLEVDGDGISSVLGNRGGVDDVQGVEAKTMTSGRCPKLPGATGRGDRRLGVVWQ